MGELELGLFGLLEEVDWKMVCEAILTICYLQAFWKIYFLRVNAVLQN